MSGSRNQVSKASERLKLVALIRVSTPGQKYRHGKERQERLEIEAYAEELEASIIDTWSIQERATVFDRPHFEACRGAVAGVALDVRWLAV